MRRRRSETTAILRRVRGALLWAVACSAAAGVCLLALPLLAALLFAPSARLSPPVAPEEYAAVAAFTLGALGLALVFMSARTRLTSRAALWTEHALGHATFVAGLDAAMAPNDLERDHQAVSSVATGIRASADVCGLGLGVAPVLFTLFSAPALGLVTAVSVIALLALAFGRVDRVMRDAARIAEARAVADGVWRTAAASSVVIAARGMTTSTAMSWRTAHARALGRAFQAAEADARALVAIRAVMVMSVVMFATAALWHVHAGSMTASVAAAAGVAHGLVMLSLDGIHRAVPLLAEARVAADDLARDPNKLATASAPRDPVEARTPGAQQQVSTPAYAEAS